MRPFKDIFIHKINFAAGDQVDILNFKNIGLSIDDCETLTGLGLKYYRKSLKSEYDLAYESASQTIQQVKPRSVERVIYASSSVDDHDYKKNQFGKLMDDLQLSEIYPVGTFLARCDSLQMSVRLAINVIISEDVNNVLVIIADRHYSNENDRVITPGNYVVSDAACSFLVSTENGGEYEILGIDNYSDQTYWNISPKYNFVTYLQGLSNGIQIVSRGLLRDINETPQSFKKIITGNYNLSVMSNYARFAGFKREQLYTDSLASYAHTFGSGQIISLKNLHNQGGLKKGDKVFVLGTGDYFFGALALTSTG